MALAERSLKLREVQFVCTLEKWCYTNSMVSLRTVSWQAVKSLIHLKFPQVPSLSVAELADWLQHPDRPLLLDARTPAEYQVSHLPEAQLVPDDLDTLKQWQDLAPSAQLEGSNRPPSKHESQRAIVVYCSVGYRSAQLVDKLQKLDFKQVLNLEGSIFEWANSGYPVYRDGTVVQQVHPYNARWGKLLRSELHSEF